MTPYRKNLLLSGARITGLGTLLSRVLGLIRDIATAALLGLSAGGVMDAFAIAIRIPNLFRRLFAEGALSASYLPVLTARFEEGPDSAWKLVSVVIDVARRDPGERHNRPGIGLCGHLVLLGRFAVGIALDGTGGRNAPLYVLHLHRSPVRGDLARPLPLQHARPHPDATEHRLAVRRVVHCAVFFGERNRPGVRSGDLRRHRRGTAIGHSGGRLAVVRISFSLRLGLVARRGVRYSPRDGGDGIGPRRDASEHADGQPHRVGTGRGALGSANDRLAARRPGLSDAPRERRRRSTSASGSTSSLWESSVWPSPRPFFRF